MKWVRAYSQAHGMLHKWRFLTGSLAELKRVWRAYGIAAAVVNGMIDHTPATYRDRPERPRVAALRDADGVLERESVGVRAREQHRRAASRPPTPAGHGVPGQAAALRPARPGHAPARGRRQRSPRPRLRARISSSSSTRGRPRSPTCASTSRRSTATRPRRKAKASRRSSRSTRAVSRPRRRRCHASCTHCPTRSRIRSPSTRAAASQTAIGCRTRPGSPSFRVPAGSSPQRISRSKAGRRYGSCCARRGSRGRSKDFSANLRQTAGSCRT